MIDFPPVHGIGFFPFSPLSYLNSIIFTYSHMSIIRASANCAPNHQRGASGQFCLERYPNLNRLFRLSFLLSSQMGG